MICHAVFELMGRLLGVSPLGDYNSPLQLLIYMTAIKPIARALVRLPKWAPRLDSGRGIQVGGPPLQAAPPHLPPAAHPRDSIRPTACADEAGTPGRCIETAWEGGRSGH